MLIVTLPCSFLLTCVKRNKEFGAYMQMCRNIIKTVLKKSVKKEKKKKREMSLQTVKETAIDICAM